MRKPVQIDESTVCRSRKPSRCSLTTTRDSSSMTGTLSNEDRFIMLGVSNRSRILVVCHCERAKASVIRVISARKATANEREYYEGPLP